LLLKTVPNASNLFAFVNLDDVNLFKHYGGGPLRERACDEVTQLNRLLASSLQNASPYTVAHKILQFESKARFHRRKQFVEWCVANLNNSILPSDNRRSIANAFHLHLHESWSQILKQTELPEMIDSLTDDALRAAVHVVDTSEGDIFYVAGWILYKLRMYQLRLEIFPHRRTEAIVWKEFVDRNSTNGENTDSTASEKVCRLEFKKGALIRCTASFLSFVSLVESLYVVNLTCTNAFFYLADLITTIDNGIHQSAQVRERFKLCLCGASTEESETIWKGFEDLMLPWYSRMKSRDVMRLLKMYRCPDRDSILSTRKKSVRK
jgi:hypothetical protein